MAATNIHGTAILVGDTGLLFLGPSGIGKSALAFDCLAAARPLGLKGFLIADDRVLVSLKDGGIVAECPAAIAGLMEIRGTGIVRMPHVVSGAIHCAILPADPASAVRLPEEEERIEIAERMELPVIRMLNTAGNPLAIIMAKFPALFG